MGCDVSPRVTYWTGLWEPQREAISKQVEALRRNLAPEAPVVSFSSGQRTRIPLRRGVIRLSGRRWLLLRALAQWLELRGQVSHLVAGMNSWHLLRALGRRPLLFTVVLPGRSLEARFQEKVGMFVAETETLAEALAAGGVDRARIQVIHPGVDLRYFQPLLPPSHGPFRLLFASSPADPRELKPRGVHLLVELARAAPDLEVLALWRRWGNLEASRHAIAALDPPANFRLVARDEPDMRQVLAKAHATACFFSPGFGKSCPGSIIEGLAAGRPALVTEGVGVASLLEREGAGCAGRPTSDCLLEALERLRADFPAFAARARRTAERHFDLDSVFSAYCRLYRELAPSAGRRITTDGSGPSRRTARSV